MDDFSISWWFFFLVSIKFRHRDSSIFCLIFMFCKFNVSTTPILVNLRDTAKRSTSFWWWMPTFKIQKALTINAVQERPWSTSLLLGLHCLIVTLFHPQYLPHMHQGCETTCEGAPSWHGYFVSRFSSLWCFVFSRSSVIIFFMSRIFVEKAEKAFL